MNAGRWWLSLAYFFATLMAQGVHDHGKSASDDILESHGDCDETRPHVADHEAPDHTPTPETCPSCQFRAEVSLHEWSPVPLPGPSVAILSAYAPTSTLPGSPQRLRCRAPPLDHNEA